MSTSKKCRGVRESVSAYGSGEFGARSRQAVEDHIATCPPCRVFFERQARLERALGALAPLPHTVPGTLPSWQEFRASLLREESAGAQSSLSRALEGCRIRFTEWLLPKTALHLSEALHFAKRAAVPALCVFIALMTYHALTGEGSRGGRERVVQTAQASPPIVIHVQFQPGEASGAVSGGDAQQGGTLRCGWK